MGDETINKAKLGVATAPVPPVPLALVWENNGVIWSAPAGDPGQHYTCDEDVDTEGRPRWFTELNAGQIGPDVGEETLEAAQAVCQHHRDTELIWRQSAPELWVASSGKLWPSEDYSCKRDGDCWTPEHLEKAIPDDRPGIATPTLDWAKELCQEHHRAGERDAKPEKPDSPPKRERGTWTLPMPLTSSEKANAKDEFDEIWGKIRRLQGATAASADRHKDLKKRNDEKIGELMEKLDELQNRMPERETDCWREHYKAEGQHWVKYTDDDGAIVHERRLDQGEQRRLFGEGDPPADKPPSEGDQLLNEVDRAIKRAGDEGSAEAIAAAGDAIDAAAAHLQAEQLKALRARAAEAAKQPPPDKLEEPEEAAKDPLPPELDLSDKLNWRHLTDGSGQRTYATGEDWPRYYVDKDDEGKRRVRYQPADGESRKLPGPHKRLKDAFAAAHKDNQRRLRWPGEPKGGVLLDSTGRYQLSRYMVSGPAGEMWQTQHLPGQDQPAVDLGDNLLPAAEAACQADADARRQGEGQ